MNKLLSRFRDDDDEFTEEEVAAAELIVESKGKKVVDANVPAFVEGQCFICRRIGLEGSVEGFTTNNSRYNLFVCNECKDTFKA